MSGQDILQAIDKILSFQDSREPRYRAPEDEAASILLPHGWLTYADLRLIRAALLRAQNEERIYDRISTRLNDYLCEMKPGYDDSIVGFNEAWDIVRDFFKKEIAA
jgi:hypothetical protein